MEINVAQLLKSPVGTVRNHTVDDVVDITENGLESEVKGELKLVHTNRSILVRGILHTSVMVACSRCLKPFPAELDLKIDDEYFPTIDVYTGVPVPVPDEPDSFTIDEHHTLSLVEAVWQYALLAIPMKPLCRPDCPGLCPTCGKNLASGECACPPPETDSRWSELLKFTSARKRK